ncbi:MAG: hypothetical protein HOV80_01870 [Polyangiaceae bacterium]|nr:hypothetical protein [Polyangiaceae bacterium]
MLIEPLTPDGKTMARGGLMRGWKGVLLKHGLLERVCGRLTPEVISLVREPPASTEWVDVAHYECVAEAVLQEAGEARLADLFVDATRTGWAVLISRWSGSIVRVFGASPATVLKHAEAAAKANTVGFALEWSSQSPSSGELIAHYPFRKRMHFGAAWGTSAACQLAADAVGATMKRARPIIEPRPEGGLRVRAPVSWT